MEIIYEDADIIVCIKPARVLSTDEPGGVPDLIREATGESEAVVRTVHRLDRVVSGLMVLARNQKAASEISRQIRENIFQKEYLAVVHGSPDSEDGVLKDLLIRDKARKMTFVVEKPQKGAQEAVLDYQILESKEVLSKVRIQLHTGRTHQIRVQFASRGWPLVGERKYAQLDDPCEIALWSHRLAFRHPTTKEWIIFSKEPPQEWPWSIF